MYSEELGHLQMTPCRTRGEVCEAQHVK